MLNEGLWQEAAVAGCRTSATGVVPFRPWASRRRHDLLELLDRLTPTIAELTQAIEQEADKCTEAQRLHTPRSGITDGTGLRIDHRQHGALSMWQTGRELSGAGAVRGFQRATATVGTHHETG